MLSWEKIDAIPGWFMFQSYCALARPARPAGPRLGRSVRDRRVARPVGVVARFLSQGPGETLSVRPQARRAGGAARHPLGRRRAGQHRAAVGAVGRPAGQARPQGHAPERALVPHRRRTHRHRGLPRARIRQPHRQHRRHRGDRRFLLAALSGQHHRSDPLPREEPVPLPPARRRFQQGLSLPAREPAALHGLHGLRHERRAFRLRRQDHDLQDHRPVGHRRRRHHRLCRRRRPDRRPRQRAAALAHDAHPPRLGAVAASAERLADVAGR